MANLAPLPDKINLFSREDLLLPDEADSYAFLQKLTRKNNRTDPKTEVPFEYYIDLWFFSLALCYKLGRDYYEEVSTIKTKIFERGSMLDRYPRRMSLITAIAISHTDNIDIIESPSRMMNIANGYACGGALYLAKNIGDAALSKVEKLTDILQALC